MQLNISEFDSDDQSVFGFNQESFKSSIADIPENMVKIKVLKKGVQFEEPTRQKNQVISKETAKIVRPKVIPQISYEDIMSKMGMFVADGKLHLMDNNPQGYQQIKNQHNQQHNQHHNQQHNQQHNQRHNQQQQNQTNIPQNSYIYNKLFKEELRPQNEIRRPMTAQEYKRKVLEKFIQSQRIREMKSRKLLMPTSNINISSGNSGNLNKLFNFSKR
jgi:protein required for attachment to host cells